jgi:hypothetical protein
MQIPDADETERGHGATPCALLLVARTALCLFRDPRLLLPTLLELVLAHPRVVRHTATRAGNAD